MIDYSRLHNDAAEREVIGSLILNGNLYETVEDILSRDIFQHFECQKAYDIISDFVKKGNEIDAAEIAVIFQRENIDITQYLTESADSYTLLRQRIAYLEDLNVRRRLVNICRKGEILATDPTTTLEEMNEVTKDFDKTLNQGEVEDIEDFAAVSKELVNDVAERKEDKGERGIMTGLHIFDSRFGWHGGDLIILAGRSSAGKTTVATTIAYNMAVAGIPSVFYSMEMSSKQLVARIMSRQTRVSSSLTLYGKLNDDEYKRVYDNALELRTLPIYFDEKSKTSFKRILLSIKRMVRRKKVKVVFIDYLQILANGADDNREAILGDMARDLKRLAVELNIAICALSQLNRSDRESGKPKISQLRGSGQIEEACDIGVLISRKEHSDVATIEIGKGRNIGLASEKIKFNSSLSYFSDFEAGDPTAPYQENKEELPF